MLISVGILPLFIGAMQNNLDASIKEIRFERLEDSLSMVIKEGEEEYRISVGFYGYNENVLDFRGEKYIIRAMASAFINASGEGEYRIEFLYPEMPNTRMLRITEISDAAVMLQFTEIPNNRIIDNILARASSESRALGLVMDLVERRFGEGALEKKVEKTFSPTIIGANIDFEGYEAIVEEESAKNAYESFSVKLLRSVVDKFFKEDKPEESAEDATDVEESSTDVKPQKSLFGSILEKILPGKKS